ncbi:MAG: AraC family transcriptional regulator [Acidobacteria bacterium]|nr:AraC family transcriptional regulator [Acidobacteriota bacterium]
MEIDFFNARSIIVFICILQGVIFAGLLIFRSFKRKAKADLWLAMLLLVICSGLITPFIGFANVYDLNQWLTFFPFGIIYATGVCIWFYVLTLTDDDRKFNRKHLLLFLPSAIYLTVRLILFAQDLEFKDWFTDKYYQPYIGPFIFVTEFLWNGFFLFLAIRHYKKYRAWLDENFSATDRLTFDWLRNFLYLFTAVFVIGAIFDFTANFLFRLSYIQYFYFELILAMLVYYLAIAGYLRSVPLKLDFTGDSSDKDLKPEDPPGPLLSAVELKDNKNRLQDLMKTEKPYLDPQLTLKTLARQIGLNTSVLSYTINTGFDKNFNDFINEYRVNEVKTRLIDEVGENLNILAIAFDSGFNSKATFNRAFKKFTSRSPKEFLSDNS